MSRSHGRLAGRFLVATLALCAGVTPGATADEPPREHPAAPSDSEVRDRVSEWLRDLSSDSYEVRERARAGLLLHGSRARDLVEAQRDHPDAEVRGAVRAVLERMEPRPEAPSPSGPAVDLAALGLVTIDVRGPLEGVFRKLGQIHDARFDPPREYLSKEAEAHVVSEPVFRVLDWISGVVGLDASSPFDASGTLTLREPREGAEAVPTAYHGPLRARLVRVTTVRTLGAGPARTHSFAVQLHWSPAIQVVSIEGPRLESVEDEKGRTLRLPQTAGGVTYGVGPASTSIELTLSFQPTDAIQPGDRLAVVEMLAPVRVRHARKSVSFRRLKDGDRTISVAPEMTGGPKGGTVTLRRFEPPEATGGTWLVEILAQLDTEAARESVRTYLEAADGSLVALGLAARSVSADGTVELVGRGRFPSGAGASGVRVAWFTGEGKGDARFRFEGVPLR